MADMKGTRTAGRMEQEYSQFGVLAHRGKIPLLNSAERKRAEIKEEREGRKKSGNFVKGPSEAFKTGCEGTALQSDCSQHSTQLRYSSRLPTLST